MVSKITFLGTAGDSLVYSKQIRSSGGFVIKTGGYQFFIDPGPGALNRSSFCNINPRETTAVIVTHSHVNHSSDLNAIVSAMSYNGIDKLGVIIANKSVIEGREGDTPVLSEFHKGCVERVFTMTEGQKIGIENMEIHAIKALHDDPDTIGLKFFTQDFVLGYTSDTAYKKELIEQYKKCDILIMNIVHPSGESSDNNLSSDDAVKILSKTKPQLAIITHFGKGMIKADSILEARRIQKESGVQVIAATDGMVISPNYYSAEMKQRTLNLYPSDEKDEDVEAEHSVEHTGIEAKEAAEDKEENTLDKKEEIEQESKAEEEKEEEEDKDFPAEEESEKEPEEKPKEKQKFLLDD